MMLSLNGDSNSGTHHVTEGVMGVLSTVTIIGSFASILSAFLSIVLTSILIFWYCVRLWADRKTVIEFVISWRRRRS